jgi:hypothetical protein
MWKALKENFGDSNAGSELYVIDQLYNYKMVDDRYVVEHAHEIQGTSKETRAFSFHVA